MMKNSESLKKIVISILENLEIMSDLIKDDHLSEIPFRIKFAKNELTVIQEILEAE